MKIASYLNKLLVFLMVINHNAAGQSLPKVIQPSPEVSALFRFQDYPMDYSTGLPSISLPVYEVKSGSLSVPISLSYHASGRRVMDEDGPIALGWALNAGGSISRTVYGDADFGTPSLGTYLFPSPLRTTGLTNNIPADLLYLEKIMHYNNPDALILPWTESEYDIFSYNFGNASGKFLFKDANNVKTPVLLPYKPYIITPYYTSQGITGIDILDDKGVLYQFTVSETSGPDNDYAVTSLFLTKIISADKADIITFQYTGFAKWTKSFSQQRTFITDWTFPGIAPVNPDHESSSQTVYQVQRLKEIDFNQGKVLFNLVAGSDKIDNIQIVNLNNQVIKTIQLNRTVLDYLNQGGTSLNPNLSQVNNKLDNVVFKDANATAVEKYSMEYFPTVFSGSENTINVHYCDYWGYYNASGKDNMIPGYTFSNGIQVGGTDFNRQPNLNALKSGVLNKITYPTGGSTSFTYETNKYLDPSSAQAVDGPGLRVAQVATTDNKGTTIMKAYKYGIAESGYGFLDWKPDVNTMTTYRKHIESGLSSYTGGDFTGLNPGGSYSQYTFYSGFTPGLSTLGSRPIIYTEVAEYLGTPTNNVGKTIYQYDNYAWAPAGMPMLSPSHLFANMHVYNWNFWNNPSLLTKTDYKTSLSGAGFIYSPRKTTINNYNITNLDDVVGLHVQRVVDLPQVGLGASPCNCIIETYEAGIGVNIYTFSDYHISAGVKNLSSSTETVYNDDGSTISNTISYQYNSNQYVNKTTKTTSILGPIITDIKYPADYTGIPVLTQMISANMLNYPVEQLESNNTTPISAVRTNYFNWGTATPMIAPQTIEAKKGANTYETRINYYGYDANGNPTSVAKEKDMVSSYIWDYNKSYPVAEVKNAITNDIAYTSFEADGNGNWLGQNAVNVVSTGNTVTGAKYYNFNGTTLSKAGLTAGTGYIVSYWTKNGMYTVSGTPVSGWPKNLRTVTINGNSWTNWEHKVTGVTTVSVSGTGNIDELRLYPDNAFMTTYTFTPLIGMSSQADVNNRVTYYEYDAYGRLKLIRDMNNNILKTFNYQYQTATPY